VYAVINVRRIYLSLIVLGKAPLTDWFFVFRRTILWSMGCCRVSSWQTVYKAPMEFHHHGKRRCEPTFLELDHKNRGTRRGAFDFKQAIRCFNMCLSSYVSQVEASEDYEDATRAIDGCERTAGTGVRLLKEAIPRGDYELTLGFLWVASRRRAMSPERSMEHELVNMLSLHARPNEPMSNDILRFSSTSVYSLSYHFLSHANLSW
jgi:hypothetical protein